MDYHNPEVDKAIEIARSTTDPKAYDDSVVKFIQLSFNDLPAIPLFQPYLNAAMRNNVTGYRYLFHRQVDYRHFSKS
jgi:peptide/nickel transport system substrate-binding protein